MKTAVVSLAIGDYAKGAAVLFHSIRKHSHTDGVDFIALTDGLPDCYTGVLTAKHFCETAKKLYAFTLPYDRIIVLDADMLCFKDCSLLWSDRINALPFYAVHDTATSVYYGKKLADLGLEPSLIFNGGTMVYNRFRLPDFHDKLLAGIASGQYTSYDGGDQGYCNAFFQANKIEVGYLPAGYNYVLDINFARVPGHAQYIAHFTGDNANPWNHRLAKDDWRASYIEAWQEVAEECIPL